MTTLLTQPNLFPQVRIFERHELPLPPCCPVSGNPQPGSVIVIQYRAIEQFLEVYSLKKYIDEYIGGHPSGIRDMEGMVQKIALDCANAVLVPVRVEARVILQRSDTLHVIARAKPDRG